MNALEQYTAY